jgi:peptidoglycan hydrolase-like protein with peptidoglycan-binding domain
VNLVYAQPGVRLARGAPTPPEVVRALQTDLRRLGYLRRGLDGQFGRETERGVWALR